VTGEAGAVRCPSCGHSETGRVGSHEFYCWNCCLEFHGVPGLWRLFSVEPDGTLIEVGGADDGAVAQAQAAEAPSPALSPMASA